MTAPTPAARQAVEPPSSRASADRVADSIADHLADPDETLRRHPQPAWWRQALAGGGLGVALLHVERARTGHGPWSRAEAWLRHAVSGPLDDGPGSHLHYGAPALGFVLHRAATPTSHHPAGRPRPGVGARALASLDARIARTTRARLDAAHRRIDTGTGPALAEFDAIRGLTGLGAYWLTRQPDHPLVRDIAGYLVRLTEPLAPQAPAAGTRREQLPGWWSPLAPSGRPSGAFPHGHINNGVAHGVGGPLALLALTAIAGITVPDHAAAIHRIRDRLDTCQRCDPTGGTWWPSWTTPSAPHLPATDRHPDPGDDQPGRPSWCYGTPGLARAHQLAGIALNDPALRRLGEHALAATTHQPTLRDTLDDLDSASLCHGHTGLLHLHTRTTREPPPPSRPSGDTNGRAATPAFTRDTEITRELRDNAIRAAEDQLRHPTPALGLLDGLAGAALALATHDKQIETGWDRCLLIS